MTEKTNKIVRYSKLNCLLNPLLDGEEGSAFELRAQIKKLFRKTIDPETGEIINGKFAQFESKMVDVQFYYKGFTKCMERFLAMRAPGQKTFAFVMKVYIETPMIKGYCDHIELIKTNVDEINGITLPFCMATFDRGVKELVTHGFLARRSSGQYWVNPNLIFRGNRVNYVRDYNAQITKLRNNPRFKVMNDREDEPPSPSEPLADLTLLPHPHNELQPLAGPDADFEQELGSEKSNSQQ